MLTSACAATTFRPGLEMVNQVIGFDQSGRLSMPPENTSWKISTKGMIVMAVVEDLARDEIHRESISEA